MKPLRWSSHSTTGDNSFFANWPASPSQLCCVFVYSMFCICVFVYLQSDHPSFCCANIILKYVTGNYWEILTFCQNKLTPFSPQRFSLMKCKIICSMYLVQPKASVADDMFLYVHTPILPSKIGKISCIHFSGEHWRKKCVNRDKKISL